MCRVTKVMVIFAITVALIFANSSFQAMATDEIAREDDTAERMAVDFILIRPLGLVATAVGTVIFIGSLPFSAAGGNTREVFQKLVEDPAKYTFSRPLGKLEDIEY